MAGPTRTIDMTAAQTLTGLPQKTGQQAIRQNTAPTSRPKFLSSFAVVSFFICIMSIELKLFEIQTFFNAFGLRLFAQVIVAKR